MRGLQSCEGVQPDTYPELPYAADEADTLAQRGGAFGRGNWRDNQVAGAIAGRGLQLHPGSRRRGPGALTKVNDVSYYVTMYQHTRGLAEAGGGGV